MTSKQVFLIFLKVWVQLLCHLNSQYIEEDVTHEENAAAEKNNVQHIKPSNISKLKSSATCREKYRILWIQNSQLEH